MEDIPNSEPTLHMRVDAIEDRLKALEDKASYTHIAAMTNQPIQPDHNPADRVTMEPYIERNYDPQPAETNTEEWHAWFARRQFY